MLLRPAEREWLYGQRHFAYGALSVLLPFLVTIGLIVGFLVD